MLNLTSSQLRHAADLKEQIATLETELAGLIGLGKQALAPVQASELATTAKFLKRTMSPAHKAKIRAAQKLRWSKYNAAKVETAPKAIQPAKKRKMSAAGRAAIAAGVKARWAKVRAAKK